MLLRWTSIAAVAALVVLSAGCPKRLPVDIPGVTGPRVSDEVRIAAVLDDVHRGMESRRIYRVLAHVSQTYRDAEGRDYEGIQRHLRAIFDNYRDIQITRVPPRIIVRGDRARAIETFGTIAEPVNPSAMPAVSQQGQVVVNLEKINGQWLIIEWSSPQ